MSKEQQSEDPELRAVRYSRRVAPDMSGQCNCGMGGPEDQRTAEQEVPCPPNCPMKDRAHSHVLVPYDDQRVPCSCGKRFATVTEQRACEAAHRTSNPSDDLRHLIQALVDQEGVLNECEALLSLLLASISRSYHRRGDNRMSGLEASLALAASFYEAFR